MARFRTEYMNTGDVTVIVNGIEFAPGAVVACADIFAAADKVELERRGVNALGIVEVIPPGVPPTEDPEPPKSLFGMTAETTMGTDPVEDVADPDPEVVEVEDDGDITAHPAPAGRRRGRK